MYLDEFSIGIKAALLVERRLRRSRADHRVRGFAEDCPDAARGHDKRVCREGAELHGAQVDGADAPAHALAIKHGAQELPMLKLGDLAFSLVTTHLLVERVEQL